MQETLNKMVSSVRQGVLGPDDASRTIHECAALLGLQLATEIPVTTLIVTGMRKTVSAQDMIDAFCEFGQISEAAVAPNKRDFGKCCTSVEEISSETKANDFILSRHSSLQDKPVSTPCNGKIASRGNSRSGCSSSC